jgi:hypothetical protein
MTLQSKKERERFFVEHAAETLGTTWILNANNEHPDFIVTEGAQRFGLEVCEIFTGQQGRAGSDMKRRESETQKAVNAVRLKYEAIANIPLRVQFVGDMRTENMAAVVPALVAEDIPSKPIGHHAVIDEDNGLRMHVTKAFRPEWFSVNHRVGFVDRRPTKRIADAIENKSKQLPRYRETAGTDIRLLIVADRFHNSGKLMLEEPIALDRKGFQAVYFLSYPESVTVFDDTVCGLAKIVPRRLQQNDV